MSTQSPVLVPNPPLPHTCTAIGTPTSTIRRVERRNTDPTPSPGSKVCEHAGPILVPPYTRP